MFNSIDINKAPSGNVHMDDLLPRIAFDTKAWKQMKMRDLFNHINANLVQSEWLTSNASGKDVSYLRPVDGIFSTESPGVSGALKIVLPMSISCRSMIKMRVQVFLYGVNQSFSLDCGGYLTGSWLQTTALIIGANFSANLTVRFGTNSDNKACIYIGELNKFWAYPKIIISEVLVGYTNGKLQNWIQGWQFAFETEAFENITRTHPDCLIKSQTT